MRGLIGVSPGDDISKHGVNGIRQSRFFDAPRYDDLIVKIHTNYDVNGVALVEFSIS